MEIRKSFGVLLILSTIETNYSEKNAEKIGMEKISNAQL